MEELAAHTGLTESCKSCPLSIQATMKVLNNKSKSFFTASKILDEQFCEQACNFLQFMKGYPQNNTGINHGQGQVCYQSQSVIEKLKKYQIYNMLNTLSRDTNSEQ